MQRPEHAGHGVLLLFVAELDALAARIATWGLEPAQRETYPNGVRILTYRDPDGNEIGFGGAIVLLPPQTAMLLLWRFRGRVL